MGSVTEAAREAIDYLVANGEKDVYKRQMHTDINRTIFLGKHTFNVIRT